MHLQGVTPIRVPKASLENMFLDILNGTKTATNNGTNIAMRLRAY